MPAQSAESPDIFNAIAYNTITTAEHDETEAILPINVKIQSYNLIILLGSFSAVSCVFYLGVKKHWGNLL